MELQFIDCICKAGVPSIPVKGISYAPESIKKELKGLNVKKAFCSLTLATKNGDFRLNRDVKKAFENDDFFLPSYTFMTNNESGETAICEFESILKEDGIRVMNLDPAAHGVVLDEFYIGEYFEVLDKLGMTVVMPGAAASAPGFPSLASKYKNINFIVQKSGFTKAPDIFTLMKKLDNIYTDVSLSIPFGIEEIARRYGSERIVFASYMPEYSPTTFVARVILASLTDSEKENIAYKNIERMTGVKLI